MALYCFKILKNCGINYLRACKIMTSSFNLKQVEEELVKNPYFDKYQEKIEKLRKEKPADYYARMKGKEAKKKVKEDELFTKQNVKYPEPKSAAGGDSCTEGSVRKCLNDVLKLELIEDKTTDEIKAIWMDYHRGKDVLFSTISNQQYVKLEENFKKYPTFVLPLPRGDGYEFFLSQYSSNILHFTPMVQYKKHGANSPECLSAVYFTELKQSKDIVLMRGEFDKDVISSLESQCLLNVTHMFYNGQSGRLIEMVRLFNVKPEQFKFPEIISELERMGFNSDKLNK